MIFGTKGVEPALQVTKGLWKKADALSKANLGHHNNNEIMKGAALLRYWSSLVNCFESNGYGIDQS